MLDDDGVVSIPPFEKGGSAKHSEHSTTEVSPHIGGDEPVDKLDSPVRATALTLLQQGASTLLKTFANQAGQPAETLLFECLCPPDFHITLFGAGHVGRALVKIMADWDCLITWVDTREDAFPADTPDQVQCVSTDTPETCVDRASPGSYFLVMTHSHALDQALCEAILKRADFAYFGLIGSTSKRRQFESRLQARGFTTERLAKMRCPIGVAGITGKEPATIAVAVAAELLQRRSQQQSNTQHVPFLSSSMT
ncbi:MAG: xanthine dehydrogenase accessory protein XdhC [Betaproteobacteria bacterium]|nr:xanthine dehydrogenase accessory protein XdhC [Betaproteobacteria bacterium]